MFLFQHGYTSLTYSLARLCLLCTLVSYSLATSSEQTTFAKTLLVPRIGSKKWNPCVPWMVFVSAYLSQSFSFQRSSISLSGTQRQTIPFTRSLQKSNTSLHAFKKKIIEYLKDQGIPIRHISYFSGG